LEKQDLVRQRY